jgi:osmotically-inducible protein OsmY
MRHQEESREVVIPTATHSSRLEKLSVELEDLPHRIEQEVQRKLLSDPGMHFSSLVVRRIPEGVCLEGVLETSENGCNVSQLIQSVKGVHRVLNHLVIRRPPAKG